MFSVIRHSFEHLSCYAEKGRCFQPTLRAVCVLLSRPQTLNQLSLPFKRFLSTAHSENGQNLKISRFEVLKQREITEVSPFLSYPPLIVVTSHECMSLGEKRSAIDFELLF